MKPYIVVLVALIFVILVPGIMGIALFRGAMSAMSAEKKMSKNASPDDVFRLTELNTRMIAVGLRQLFKIGLVFWCFSTVGALILTVLGILYSVNRGL